MPEEAAEIWIRELDSRAGSANGNLTLMERSFTNGSSPEVCVANALRSISSQLAYANTVAAAEFYMRHLREES